MSGFGKDGRWLVEARSGKGGGVRRFRIEYTLDSDMVRSMEIVTMELPPIGTNAFALIDPSRKECVIIDAPAEAYRWASGVADEYGCTLSALILTHGHWDHLLDGWAFAEAGIPVYGHRDDAVLFEDPACMMNYSIPGIELRAVPIDHWLQPGEPVQLLGREMAIRHVPGHCPGNVLVYLPQEGVAFVGDAIFAGSIGRYDLPGGDFAVLERSIREQIYTLPDGTVLYPGHGPKTSVGAEKRSNPYVRP